MPARGYQSTVSPILHFGLGEEDVVDSLRVVWLSGKEQVLRDVKANQLITLDENEATGTWKPQTPPKPLMQEVKPPFVYQHASADLNDFKRQPLLINPLPSMVPAW
jgi:ASPIC and UnbV.